MRLIDADYITEGRVSNDPVVIAAKCAPTIDAIPVEWLKEHDGVNILDSDGNAYIRRRITVVKAQEPRVMTLEELHGWEETPLRQRNPIFIEFKGTGLTAWRTYFDAVRRVSMGSVRCWTSRPTDEQREAVKWE